MKNGSSGTSRVLGALGVLALFMGVGLGPAAVHAQAPATQAMTGLRDYRYGEVLLVRQTWWTLTVEVYNTLGYNECPDDLWNALDAKAIAKERGAKLAKLNGPRYWMMDELIGAGMSTTGRMDRFGGIEMALRGTLKTNIFQGTVGDAFYTPTTVKRETVYVFKAGLPVYELVSPKGEVYVMQSYSRIADPALSMADLAGLGARLKLPSGWAFRSRVPDGDLRLEARGEAFVINDELYNSYQSL